MDMRPCKIDLSKWEPGKVVAVGMLAGAGIMGTLVGLGLAVGFVLMHFL